MQVTDVLDVTDVTKHLTKNQMLEERDFQAMYGLARDVDRLRGGLRVVILAVRAAQKHPDPENLDLLAEAVAMLGDLPELPTRNSFARLVSVYFAAVGAMKSEKNPVFLRQNVSECIGQIKNNLKWENNREGFLVLSVPENEVDSCAIAGEIACPEFMLEFNHQS